MNITKIRVNKYEELHSSPATVLNTALEDYTSSIMVTECASNFALVVGGRNSIHVPSALPNANKAYRDLVSYADDRNTITRSYRFFDEATDTVMYQYGRIAVSSMLSGYKYFLAFQVKTQITETLTVLVGGHPSPVLYVEIT